MWLFIIINGIACFFIGAALGYAGKKWYRFLLMVSSPFFCAYIMYWILVFARGGDQSGEFAAWSGVFIIAWAIPSYLPLLLGFAVGKGEFEDKPNDS